MATLGYDPDMGWYWPGSGMYFQDQAEAQKWQALQEQNGWDAPTTSLQYSMSKSPGSKMGLYNGMSAVIGADGQPVAYAGNQNQGNFLGGIALPVLAATGAGAAGALGLGASGAEALGSEFGAQGNLAQVLAGGGADVAPLYSGGAAAAAGAGGGAAAGDIGSEFGQQGNLAKVLSGEGSYTAPLYSGGSAALGSGLTVGNAASAGSLASRLLGFDTGISNGDLTRMLGSLGAAGLSAVGSNNQARSLSALANQYSGYGAPSRARYEASFQPGFTMASDPGYTDALDQTAKATLHGLSTQGNPVGSPNAWSQTLSDVNSKFAYPALQNYRTQNASAGGLSAGATAAPQIATNAITAQGQALAPFGGAISDIFNPPKSLQQILAGAFR